MSASDHSSYKIDNENTFRIIGDYVLVRMDPEEDTTASGLLHIPQTAHETILGTGTVLAYGMKRPKKSATPVPIEGIETGKKCCFIKFLKNQAANEQFRRLYQNDVVLLQSKDIMLLWYKENPIRVT